MHSELLKGGGQLRKKLENSAEVSLFCPESKTLISDLSKVAGGILGQEEPTISQVQPASCPITSGKLTAERACDPGYFTEEILSFVEQKRVHRITGRESLDVFVEELRLLEHFARSRRTAVSERLEKWKECFRVVQAHLACARQCVALVRGHFEVAVRLCLSLRGTQAPPAKRFQLSSHAPP